MRRATQRWWMVQVLVTAVVWAMLGAASAAPATATALEPDPDTNARMMAIATELRCLVCQNQTVADSHADLAVDLRKQIITLLQQGQTDAQVRQFMTERYGDFILYRPPVDARTSLLWFGPAALAVLGLVGLWWMLRQRARMPAQAFDPDAAEPADEEASRG